MDASQALREMIGMCGLTHRQIETRARRYGGWVGQTMARPRLGADVLADVARACGYRLELVPTIGGGEAIAIGDDVELVADERELVERARAHIAAASALLEAVGD